MSKAKWINHFPLIRRCCCCVDSVSPNWIFRWKRLSIKHLLHSSSSKLSQNQRFNGITYYYLLIITISTNLLKLDNTWSISQHFHINYLISLHAFHIFELLICANHCSRQEWGIKHGMDHCIKWDKKNINSYHLLIEYSVWDTVWNILQIFSHVISRQLYGVIGVIPPL